MPLKEQQKSTHHVTNFAEDVQLLVEENVQTVKELSSIVMSVDARSRTLEDPG